MMSNINQCRRHGRLDVFIGVAVIILMGCSYVGSWMIYPTITTTSNSGRSSASSSCRRYVHSAVLSPLCTPLPMTLPTTSTTFQKKGSDFYTRTGNQQQGKDDVSNNSNTDVLTMNIDDDNVTVDSKRLHDLCRYLGVETKQDNDNSFLRFESTTTTTTTLAADDDNDDGERGIYLSHPVKRGDTVLRIPLSSCLVDDDQSPSWLIHTVIDDPSRWATRLAARFIALYLEDDNKRRNGGNDVAGRSDDDDDDDDNVGTGLSLWLSMLPDQEYLRASLPVHWEESTVRNARSTALELAVDSTFFARAEAVEDLLMSLRSSPYGMDSTDDDGKTVKDENYLRWLCHHALDIVQTRSCRLEDDDAPYPRRALAPVFDFINHGARSSTSMSGAANSYFEMESVMGNNYGNDEKEDGNDRVEKYLVVRALRDIQDGEEVLIDYGSSARPAWKCLLSYGFVPNFTRRMSSDHNANKNEYYDDYNDDEEEDENLAEVYMMGVRYEVTADTVPLEMVEAVTACTLSDTTMMVTSSSRLQSSDDGVIGDRQTDDVALTPDIAIRIARRISEAAYHLLLEPELLLDIDDDDGYDDDLEGYQSSSGLFFSSTPFDVISKRLAASLRWSQHRVLLACADGLRGYANEKGSGPAAASRSYSSSSSSSTSP